LRDGRDGRDGILAAVVSFSLRFRGVILVLAGMLLVYGVYSLTGAKYDVFPEFAPPQVTIRVEAPGFSPEQVEALVTTPVENAIRGVEGIESLLSRSLQGLSAITLKFQAGSDVYRIRQLVVEALASSSGQLPQGVAPFITPLTSSTGTVLQLGLSSTRRSLMDLRTIADWTVKPSLLAALGVAQVQVYGGQVKQLQVQLSPDRLIQHGLSVNEVLVAARRATGVRGAGFIDTENQRIVLQTEGQSLLPDQLGRTALIRGDRANVTLGDVAKVAEGPAPIAGAASVNGRPGIVLLVSSQYGANTLAVTRNLDRVLAELRPTLEKEGVTLHPDLFRPATFIQTAIHNLLRALEVGAILVVIVLFLFLFNFRTAAISFTAIPLSLLAAILVLERLGFSLNTMVLGGLAIAIGEVVDDAVIDVENIFRRLRENRLLENPRPALRVALNASLEVRRAVVFATLSVVLVFLPVLTLSGLAGRLFAPLAIAYILAVLASLLVALTLTPALCLLFLRRPSAEKEPTLVRWAKHGYDILLLRVGPYPRVVSGITAAIIVAGIATLPFLREDFLPQLREGDFIVHMVAAPGTSLEESLRLGRQVALDLFKLPHVRAISQKTGRANEGSSIRGSNASEIDVALKSVEGEPAGFSRPEIRRTLRQIPGVNFAINSFLTERIEETVSGYTAPVAISIFGPDLDVLDQKGWEIAGILGKIPGAADVLVQSIPGTPQIMVRLRKEALLHWGFDPVEVLDAIHTAYQGSTVGQIYQGERVFDVSVSLNPRERKVVSAVGKLTLRSPGGVYVRLQDMADIYETPGRSVVLHQGGRRVQVVTCDVSTGQVSAFAAEAKRRIFSTVSLPPGTYIEFPGSAEEQARSQRDLLMHSVLAATGIVLLLSVVLGDYRNALLVLLNLPFALVGGVFAALLSGGLLSLGSMVGFVTVFGISLRNSIMMISHYEHLVSGEGVPWGPQVALRGAGERLAPILMTALVTALGLLPLAIGSHQAGREIEGPMAIVILGGLVTSTALNLLVLPTLALKYGRFGRKMGEE
jgi:CzcA family heavy metal efflux pump